MARAAGERAVAGRTAALAGGVGTKTSPTDVVTAMDTEVEALVRRLLREERPGDAVLGEEGGGFAGDGGASTADAGVRWVVDPIDGTVNFLYGLPAWAVSIAAEVDGEVVAGVVRDAVGGHTWSATAGGGAYLDGQRLRCSAATDLASALVATGFGYRAEQRAAQAALLATVLPAVRDVRRMGAASLDLCAVAAGRVDCYYEAGLQPWDLAAGGLVAREAGAVVEVHPSGTVLAAPPALLGPLRELLERAGLS